MSTLLRLILAVWILSGAAPAWSSPAEGSVSYHIQPVPMSDRTDLLVTAKFAVERVDALELGLPRDCYGSPDLHEAVVEFTAVRGSLREGNRDPQSRTLIPDADGVVEVAYRLSFDPALYAAYPFGPNTGPGHFHVGGCQYMLVPSDVTLERTHQITVGPAPEGWRLYASLAPDAGAASLTASYEDLSATAIGGGPAHERFSLGGRPVDVFLSPDLALPRDDVMRSIRAVVGEQRARFGVFDQDFYTISVNPRSGVMAGTAIDNLFVVFIRPDATTEELLLLLAHEMFHNEIPIRLSVKAPPGVRQVIFEWFNEGVADFASRRLLLDAGALDQSDFARIFNGDLDRLRFSPLGRATVHELTAAAEAGRFTGLHKKLAYFRGSLMALSWDAQLRAMGHGDGIFVFFDALHEASDGGVVTAEMLFEQGARLGLDIRGDYDRYIVRGERIEPVDFAIQGHVLREVQAPSWNIGFDYERSRETGVIEGVERAGPAYAAGLRNGMILVSADNISPQGLRIHMPVQVRVRSQGEERVFEYRPEGPLEPALRFMPATSGGEIVWLPWTTSDGWRKRSSLSPYPPGVPQSTERDLPTRGFICGGVARLDRVTPAPGKRQFAWRASARAVTMRS